MDATTCEEASNNNSILSHAIMAFVLFSKFFDVVKNAACRWYYHLEAAKLLEAFRAIDRWDANRWELFCDYTDILDILFEEYFAPCLESEIAPLKAIVVDQQELKLYRIEAAHTCGILFEHLEAEDKADDCYREAVQLAEVVPRKEKRHQVWVESPRTLRRMGRLISKIVDECKDDIDFLTCDVDVDESEDDWEDDDDDDESGDDDEEESGEEEMEDDETENAASITMSGEKGEIDRARMELFHILPGEQCDCCGKSLEELGRASLDVCSGCHKANYCGKECQRKHWKVGHKSSCRKTGESKPAD